MRGPVCLLKGPHLAFPSFAWMHSVESSIGMHHYKSFRSCYFSWQFCGFSNNHSHEWCTNRYNWKRLSQDYIPSMAESCLFATRNPMLEDGFYRSNSSSNYQGGNQSTVPGSVVRPQHVSFPHRQQSGRRNWRSNTGERKGRIMQRCCTHSHPTWWLRGQRQHRLSGEEEGGRFV